MGTDPTSGPPVSQQKPDAGMSKDGPVVPKRGEDWWYGGWFTPPPETGELETSHVAVTEYHKTYEPGEHFPWRFSRSAATGLPSHLRGWLEDPPGSEAEEAEATAQQWLEHSLVVPMLIGREEPREWEERFPGSPEVIESCWRRPSGAAQQDERGGAHIGKADLNPGALMYPEGQTPPERAEPPPVVRRRFLVLYQQWHGEWPVFGSQIGVHIVEGDRRLACTSSYLPISKEPEEFAPPHLSDTEVYRIARQALAHHLEDTSALDAWEAWIHRYAGSDEVVLPFAGDFHLAYQVRVKPSVSSVTWRVFVDVQTGEVLGRPQPLALRNWVFESSADALNDTPSLPTPLLDNPCQGYMDVVIASEATDVEEPVEEPPAWGLDPPQPPHLGNDPQVLQFEAFNVAFHTDEFHKYLQDTCGADPASRPVDDPKRLRAVLDEAGTDGLDTFFDFGAGEIVFQHDDGTGLGLEDQLVYHPARDPEVIYHEMAHALMWLVHEEPFEALPPFPPPVARAILEGYANYFARSCAASRLGEAPPGAHWAAAAYREWGDRWALFRQKREPGQDVLPVAELYPFSETRFNLDDYDVGMIWARALWDLRRLVGPAIADRLAWNTFTSVHGRITSFEPFVESLLDLAHLLENAEENEVHWGNVLLPVLANRRLLSEQGVQALAAGGGSILAGTSEGLWRSDGGGNTWAEWGQLGSGETLRDVVALAVDEGAGGTVFYAATYARTTTAGGGMEAGVYRRAPDNPHWTPVGKWRQNLRQNLRPLSLTVAANGDLYAGTGQGVRRFATTETGPAWRCHNPPVGDGQPFHGLALGVAFRLPQGATSALCVAGFDGLWWRLPGSSEPWHCEKLQDEATDVVTSVAADGAEMFVGTVRAGIWQGVFHPDGRFNRHNKKRIASPAQLDQAAVLSMVAAEDTTPTLYAGTTAGVFRGRPTNQDNWDWHHLTGLPKGADVLSLLVTASGSVLAGTAIHGLWQWDGTTWSQVTGVPALIPPLAGSPPIPPFRQNTLVSFAPFYLPQAQPIDVATNMPVGAGRIELWGLSPHVDRIESSGDGTIAAENQEPGFYAIAIRR